MNVLFKMLVVVFVMGVLVLQGCSTRVSQSALIQQSDSNTLLIYACKGNDWDSKFSRHIKEAKSRGLSCKIKNSKSKIAVDSSNLNSDINISINAYKSINQYSDYVICLRTKWREGYLPYQGEAERRGLNCAVKDKKTVTTSNLNKKNNIDITTATCALMPSMLSCRFLRKSEIELCESINGFKRGVVAYDNYSGSLKEAKRRGLDCGVRVNNQNVASSNLQIRVLNLNNEKLMQYACENGFWDTSYKLHIKEAKKRGLDCSFRNKKNDIASKNKSKTVAKPKTNTSSIALDAANKKARELEKKLAVFENKQKQEQQRIVTDTRVPLLEIISNKTEGKRGTIIGIARDNVEVVEVTVDGQTVQLSGNGRFKYSTFVPSDGITLNVQVTDVAGLTSTKIVSLQRNDNVASTAISFDRLNPLGKRVKTNSNALALIVGVEGYKNTNADAIYADKDAKMFRDYASEKLGIPENRIKTLLNDKAEYAEILLTTKDWLRRASKSNKSDIYIFFAGHGLASDDGKNMYLLPYDGRPRLLDKTALLRDELFKEIQQSNPRSVTVFLDTCYSGTTRGTDMLVASRPIMIKAKEQSIPSNFTVFSAAAGDQTSKPLEEAKHGMFSYFLMKGMEGDADTNADNKITARELHIYVKQNVVQQSSGSQTPELQGDKDRVLVQFN